MKHPTTSKAHSIDLEKNSETVDVVSGNAGLEKNELSPIPIPGKLARWNARIESLAGLEARGIARVPPEERHPGSMLSYVQMSLLWFSANVTANNLAVGLLGPLVFGLGFTDSALCAVFGTIVGSAVTAYMSIWGAQSGSRTMVVARYFMGYWPAKITCFLNMILMVGYATISCIIAGQILSAVSGGSLSVVVGIVIVALISWLVAVFGMALFHSYERYAWIPQVLVLLVLCGTAGPHFNTSLPSTGSIGAVTAGRLSFFSLILSVPLSWAGAASDFYVYYPETTTRWKVFLMTFTGLTLSFVFVNLIGVGLGCGMATTPAWSDAYGISSGALILAGYDGVGGFGKFCGVVVALGVISNNVPGTYAAALGCQVLGRYGKAIPRYVWVCVVVLVYFVCAVAGRNDLFAIFVNFLALMGYWLMIFVSIVLEEHLLFRRGVGFDWSAWDDAARLPIGLAALAAFLIGWAGAIVGMSQVWYVGPVARNIGGVGADIGVWVATAFTLVTFPPLRWLELRMVGR